MDESSSINVDDSYLEHQQIIKEMFINGKLVTKLVYGKQGLVGFLNHLFGLLDEQQLKQVNYYYSLKDQFIKMQGVKETFRKEIRNDVIEEDSLESNQMEMESEIVDKTKFLIYSPSEQKADVSSW